MKLLSLVVVVAMSGCATYLDPNYAIQIDAYRLTVASQQAVEVAKANAEEARYNAMSAIAQNSDAGTRSMALLALALAKNGGGSAGNVNVVLPQAPERQEDRALRWAAVFAGPVASLIQGWYGYRVAAIQSDNNRDTSIASYNALGTLGVAGFSTAQGIATAGFGANASIVTGGFGALQNIAVTGLNRPPTITLNGTGVISGRDGSYTGPNSGANSGNTGRIASPDDDHHAVTCTPTATVPC